jgi:hypothetical protein
LNNQQMADLVATVASKLDEGPPARALVVVDPNDPFSADLAQCFTASLEQLDPQTRIIWREWMPSPGRAFGTLEGDAAEMLSPLLEENVKARAGTRDWLVLTVQGSPARQVLQSLRDLGPEHRVRVLAGDGIGRTTLESFAGQLPFPLCAATSVSAEVPGWLMSPQGQVGQTQAELATALLAVFDESGPGADLLPALAALHWTRDSAHAVGRSLVFADRDRAGDDVGQVLEIVPGSRHVLSHAPVSSGEAAAAKLSGSAARVDSAVRPRP